MKRFVWRLQRLLDVKTKQEDAMRSELIAITEKAVALRSKIMLRKAALRQTLSQLAQKEPSERLSEQEFFFKYAHVSKEEIEKMELRLSEIEKLRQSKIKEIMRIRKFRKGLEKLRTKAKNEFTDQQNKDEQKQLDEIATMAAAREIICLNS